LRGLINYILSTKYW